MVFLGGAVLANIVSSPHRYSLTLMCANARSQMADKENMWISKAEWEEQGPRAIEKLGSR